jgi:hypothetical protein
MGSSVLKEKKLYHMSGTICTTCPVQFVQDVWYNLYRTCGTICTGRVVQFVPDMWYNWRCSSGQHICAESFTPTCSQRDFVFSYFVVVFE